jgi:uncharacterized damage-inducible protein DinB
MKIRFDVNDARGRSEFLTTQLCEALSALPPDRKPVWGGFSAAQMVEHLLSVFELSTGKTSSGTSLPEAFQVKARAFLQDNRPMPRGFESPLHKNGVPPLRFETIPEAIEALRVESKAFLELCASHPDSVRVHPAFGPCSPDEWSRMHFKHGVHHLVQFGLVEVETVP